MLSDRPFPDRFPSAVSSPTAHANSGAHSGWSCVHLDPSAPNKAVGVRLPLAAPVISSVTLALRAEEAEAVPACDVGRAECPVTSLEAHGAPRRAPVTQHEGPPELECVHPGAFQPGMDELQRRVVSVRPGP